MKRQSDTILDQPTVKKSDGNASTDLRSKIGAKLQTLLHTSRAEALRRKKAILFKEPEQYSEIIIDPGIVVKTEPEECDSIKSVLNSPNFLLSAKSRITELLNKGGTNKFKHHEKENSSNKCNPVSSTNSATTSSGSLLTQTSNNIQSLSSNSFNKKRNGNNSVVLPASSSDASIKNACIVLEDVMKNGTEVSHLSSSKSASESLSSRKKAFPFDRSKGRKTAKASNSSSPCDNASSALHNSPVPQSSRNSNATENMKLNGKNSKSSANCKAASACNVQVINLGDLLIAPKVPVITSSNVRNEPELTTLSVPILDSEMDDSELVDDPSVLENGLNTKRNASGSEKSSQNESHDPDVVLICVKEPTAEVITLDDVEENPEDLLKEVHKCSQCDKAFRAKSLLNFHIRMHGSDTSTSSQLSNSS